MGSWIDRLRHWAHDLAAWMEAFASHPNGAWVLFSLAFAESSFFPLPPDALLIPLCLANPEKAFWFAGVCSVGSVLGGIFGYGIGYWGGRPVLKRFFSPEKISRVEQYYDRYNAWATAIAGLTPIPYKIFTISGGAFGVGFKVFVLASIFSRTLRFFAVAAAIYWLGETARDLIERYFGVLSIAFVVLLILGFWVVGRGASRAVRDEIE